MSENTHPTIESQQKEIIKEAFDSANLSIDVLNIVASFFSVIERLSEDQAIKTISLHAKDQISILSNEIDVLRKRLSNVY